MCCFDLAIVTQCGFLKQAIVLRDLNDSLGVCTHLLNHLLIKMPVIYELPATELDVEGLTFCPCVCEEHQQRELGIRLSSIEGKRTYVHTHLFLARMTNPLSSHHSNSYLLLHLLPNHRLKVSGLPTLAMTFTFLSCFRGWLLQLVSPRLAQDSRGPVGEEGLVVSQLLVLEEGEARGGEAGRAWLAVGVVPCALVPHSGPVGQPAVHVLANSGELQPPLGEELHHAAVLVHEEHVGQLGSVWRRQDVCSTHQLHLDRSRQ